MMRSAATNSGRAIGVIGPQVRMLDQRQDLPHMARLRCCVLPAHPIARDVRPSPRFSRGLERSRWDSCERASHAKEL